MKLFGVATLLLFSAYACGGNGSMKQPQITLDVEHQSLDDGRVIIVSTLINTTSEPLVFLPWNTPFDTHLTSNFLDVDNVTGGKNEKLRYRGAMVKRAAPQQDDYVTVPAQSELKNAMDISSVYLFCNNQRYIVSFNRELRGPDAIAISLNSTPLEFDTINKGFTPCS